MANAHHRGSTELEVLRPELWSSLFYDTLLSALPFNSVVSRDYQGDASALGNKVNISQFPQFPLAELITEDQAVESKAVTATGVVLEINRQIALDFSITDRAKVQTLDAMNALRDLVFHSIMLKMQSLIIAATIPSAAAPDHAITYVTAGTLALEDILAAKELKDSQNVSPLNREMILDSPQWNDIFNITGFTSRDFISTGSPLEGGNLPGQILGYNPKMTTEAAGVAFLFHPSYMQVAVQRGMDVRSYDKGVQGIRSDRVNATLLMGEVQSSDIRVVTIS